MHSEDYSDQGPLPEENGIEWDLTGPIGWGQVEDKKYDSQGGWISVWSKQGPFYNKKGGLA